MIFIFDPKKDDTKRKEKRKTRKSFLGVALARDFANRSYNAISRLKRGVRELSERREEKPKANVHGRVK